MMLAFHVVLCVVLVGVVLVQAGRGGGAFGPGFSGSAQSLFGASGAGNFLTRLTTIVAVLFFVTSLLLTINTAREASESLVKEDKQTQPATPEQAAPQAPIPSPTPQPQP